MEQRKVILILGQTGTGKSELAKKIIEKFPRVVIIDIGFEYPGVIVTSFKQLVDQYLLLRENNMAHRFCFSCRFETEMEIDLIYKFTKEVGNILLVVEEAALLNLRQDDFKWLVVFGRHRHISLLCVAQRAPDLLIQFRSQVKHLYTFQQEEPRDIEHLARWGVDMEELSSLSGHEYLCKGLDLLDE